MVALLGRAQDTRLLGDYDAAAASLRARTTRSKSEAPEFVAFCRRLIGSP